MSTATKSKSKLSYEGVTPIRVGASLPVILIRDAYDKQPPKTRGKGSAQIDSANLAREQAALVVGHDVIPTATDEQIIKIATGNATLRGFSDTGITYHDEPCVNCKGAGTPAPTRAICRDCNGDGFAPPTRET